MGGIESKAKTGWDTTAVHPQAKHKRSEISIQKKQRLLQALLAKPTAVYTTAVHPQETSIQKKQRLLQALLAKPTAASTVSSSTAMEDRTTHLCDFAKNNVQTPLFNFTVSNAAEEKSAEPQDSDAKMREIPRCTPIRRAHSNPDVRDCRPAFLRRNSATTFRDVNMIKSDRAADIPKNTPCKPDLMTCCQNVAAFLAKAAAKDNRSEAPSAEYIYSYMRSLFVAVQLEPECCVYADIYFRRLLINSKGNLKVHSKNWHKILVGACLLASKYVDDLAMRNKDVAKVLNGCSLQSINKLESEFVEMLKWQLHVPISEYTTRYFELAKQKNHA